MTIINQKLITSANDQSFFGHSGDSCESSARAKVEFFTNHFEKLEKRLGGYNENQLQIIAERTADFTALVREQMEGVASFKANNPSWMVTGPARYNFARHEKRMNAMENKYQSYEEKAERFIINTENMLKSAMTDEAQINLWRLGLQCYGETIQSNDRLAVEKMTAQIEHLEHVHKIEITANKWIRDHKTATGCPVLFDDQIKKVNADLERWPYKVRKYFFTDNGSANIRKKIRLEQLKKEREQAIKAAEEGDNEKDVMEGVKMVNNHEAARIQLIFDGKPSEERRNILKANGFRWSPRFGAWQRQNTPNGIIAAERVLKEIKEVA